MEEFSRAGRPKLCFYVVVQRMIAPVRCLAGNIAKHVVLRVRLQNPPDERDQLFFALRYPCVRRPRVACDLPHRSLLFRLRDECGCTPVLTQGARGGLWLDGARPRRFRSPRVRVCDTTGAGDAFHGAFAAGLAQGLSWSANLARAARSGARCCTAMGGFAAVVRTGR